LQPYASVHFNNVNLFSRVFSAAFGDAVVVTSRVARKTSSFAHAFPWHSHMCNGIAINSLGTEADPSAETYPIYPKINFSRLQIEVTADHRDSTSQILAPSVLNDSPLLPIDKHAGALNPIFLQILDSRVMYGAHRLVTTSCEQLPNQPSKF
jgi:hypothetical protein